MMSDWFLGKFADDANSSSVCYRTRLISAPIKRFLAYGWWIVWILLTACFVAPLWCASVLPLCDLPNHLARITALHYLDHPGWNLGAFYVRSLSPVPYFGHIYVVHLMTYLFGSVPRANLVYMSVYVAAVPLSGRSYARAAGRDPWLAFLLLPLAVGVFFQWGFIAFCAGAVLLLPACAVLSRQLETPSRAGWMWLGVLGCALYFFHILDWMAFGLYAAVLLAIECMRGSWRRPLRAAAVMLPSLALFGLGLRSAQSFGYIRSGDSLHASLDPPGRLLERVVELLDIWPARRVDEWVEMALGLAVLLLLITDTGPQAGASRRRVTHPWLGVVVFAVAAALTPFWIVKPLNWWMINVRFLMLAAMMAVFLPRGPIRGARSLVLAAALAVICLFPLGMARAYRGFSRRAEPLVQLINSTPLGSSTLLLHGPPPHQFGDPEVATTMAVWREVYNYPIVYRGGYDPYMYDDGFPIRRRAALGAPKVASVAVRQPTADEQRFRPDQMMAGWDYFIVWLDNPEPLPPDGVLGLKEAGRWKLYRNLNKERKADSSAGLAQ